MIARLIGTALLGAGALLVAGCGSRPDGVTRQFFDRMAALDSEGMSQLVCQDERADFRESVDFLQVVSDAGAVQLQDFNLRTERADGTAITLRVSGRFVSADLGEMPASGRVRLVRDGGEWCISGERDGFGSISDIAGDLFALLIRSGTSGDAGFDDGRGGEWIVSEARTPAPDGPPSLQGEVIANESGLRYIDIQEGAGQRPQPGQTVRVHYTLWIEASGKMIDSSLMRGEPFEFVLGSGQVVDGFDEGLSTMREGGRRRLVIPPKLGYGDDDDYGDIPPNSTLVFDVELVEVR